MFNLITKLFKSSVLAALVLLLTSCGGGSPSSAQGGSIVIAPSKISFKNNAGTCTGSAVNYSVVKISVFNANGVPVANAPLSISVDLASGTTKGLTYPAVYLYDTDTIPSTPPPTGLVSGTLKSKTGSDGTKTVVVGEDIGGCIYTANLNVYSDTLSQLMPIDATN